MRINTILISVLCVSLVICGVPVTAFAETTETEVILYEPFDSPPSPESVSGQEIRGWNDWGVFEGASSYTLDSEFTIFEEEDGNKTGSFYRSKSDSSSRQYLISKSFPEVHNSGIINIHFKLKPESETANSFEMQLVDSTGAVLPVYIRFSASYIYMKGGSQKYFSPTWSAEQAPVGVWYEFDFVMDLNKNTLRYYVNGKVLGVAQTMSGVNGSLAKIAFGTERQIAATTGNSAQFYIDDIELEKTKAMELSKENATENTEISNTLELVFSNPINTASFSGATAEMVNSPITVQKKEISEDDGRKLILTFSETLDFNTEYTLKLSGFGDNHGQTMKETLFTFKTRERKLVFEKPEFYTGYLTSEETKIELFEENDVTGVINILNEKDSSVSAVAVMLLFDNEGILKDVTAKPVFVNEGKPGKIDLTLDTTDGAALKIYIWNDFDKLNPIVGEYVFDENGCSEEFYSKSAEAESIEVTPNYDLSTVDIKITSATEGMAGFYILRPDAENISLEKISEEIVYLGNSETNKEITYALAKDLPYGEYMVVSGTAQKKFLFFGTQIVENALKLVKDSDISALKALLDEENPLKTEGGYYLNDLFHFDLTDYNQIEDKEVVLDKIAGKEFESASDCREVFEEAASKQKIYETDVADFLKKANAYAWSELEQLFKESSDLINLNWNGSYLTLSESNKILFYKILAADYTYSKLDDVIKAFNESLNRCTQNVVIVNKPSGGGGSGSGGSASSASNYNFEQPKAETEKFNQEKEFPFSDCENVQWAKEAVFELNKRGIINGIGNGLYEPDAPVTREQFVKIISLAFDLPVENQRSAFSDVPANEWYYPYVSAAYNSKIVVGISDEKFGTGDFITRADMAVLAKRAMDYSNIIMSEERNLSFADEAMIPDYARESVSKLCSAALMNGIGDGRFAPNDTATRAMAAKLIYEIIKLKP